MKLLKKIALGSFVGLSALTLAACGEETAPEGIDNQPKNEEEIKKVYEDLNAHNLNDFFTENYKTNLISFLNGENVIRGYLETNETSLDGSSEKQSDLIELKFTDDSFIGYEKISKDEIDYYYAKNEKNVYEPKLNYFENQTTYNYIVDGNVNRYSEERREYQDGDVYYKNKFQVNNMDINMENLNIAKSLLSGVLQADDSLINDINLETLKTETLAVINEYSALFFANLINNYIEPVQPETQVEPTDPEAKLVFKLKTKELIESFGINTESMDEQAIAPSDVIEALLGEDATDLILNDLFALLAGNSTKITALNPVLKRIVPQILAEYGLPNLDLVKGMIRLYANQEFPLPEEASMILLMLSYSDIRVELYNNVKKVAFVATIPSPEREMTFNVTFEAKENDGKLNELDITVNSNMIPYEILVKVVSVDENTVTIDLITEENSFNVVLTKNETGFDLLVNNVLLGLETSKPTYFPLFKLGVHKEDRQTLKIEFEIVEATRVTIEINLTSCLTINVKTEGYSNSKEEYLLNSNYSFIFDNKEIIFDLFEVDEPKGTYGEEYDQTVGRRTNATFSFVNDFDADLVNEIMDKVETNIISFSDTYEDDIFKLENAGVTIKNYVYTGSVNVNGYAKNVTIVPNDIYNLNEAIYIASETKTNGTYYYIDFDSYKSGSITYSTSKDEYDFIYQDGEFILDKYYVIVDDNKVESDSYNEELLETFTREANEALIELYFKMS